MENGSGPRGWRMIACPIPSKLNGETQFLQMGASAADCIWQRAESIPDLLAGMVET